jgi:hypothetical protein
MPAVFFNMEDALCDSLLILSTGGKKCLQFCATDGKKLTPSLDYCQTLHKKKSDLMWCLNPESYLSYCFIKEMRCVFGFIKIDFVPDMKLIVCALCESSVLET